MYLVVCHSLHRPQTREFVLDPLGTENAALRWYDRSELKGELPDGYKDDGEEH